jgi:hypothetical protein
MDNPAAALAVAEAAAALAEAAVMSRSSRAAGDAIHVSTAA